MKILHFADAHIDMANYGRHDPVTGLPLRVLDFLKSLDVIVDTAISEKVDLVIFAGDAYKDRSPAPTFQREWGRRIIRLSQAHIPTLLLVGNHDISPALGRANAIHEFSTLQVPYIRVLDRPEFLGPPDLWDLPIQVISMPWISRSGFMAAMGIGAEAPAEVFKGMEDRIRELVEEMLDRADPAIPTILTAHASVEGASYGGERMVMLGADLVLPTSLVKDKRLSYVALGHIHKPQDLNKGLQPPVIYPGSIERVDFGESQDNKFFILADVKCGDTQVEWRQLKDVRPFLEARIVLDSSDGITGRILAALPDAKRMEGAVVRLVIDYPREWETLIDEAALRKHTESAFEFHLVKRPQIASRVRIPEGQAVSSLSPLELLMQYWQSAKMDQVEDLQSLQVLAQDIISGEEGLED
jgi:exonuclease SbcD